MQDHCEKVDAWDAQRERNERYDRMFDKIEQHMGEQTALMRDIAKQGERIATLQRDQRENRQLIDKLFDRNREDEKSHADFRTTVTARFHQIEIDPIREQRVEKLRFSTGAWLVLVTVALNLLVGWLKGLSQMGVGP
jgi:predicted RNase H-like nuclease (RuvC/YqgF family)